MNEEFPLPSISPLSPPPPISSTPPPPDYSHASHECTPYFPFSTPVAYTQPRSGNALEDPEFCTRGDTFPTSPLVDGLFFGRHHHRRPPVTVHAKNVPLASLARLDRSFVGAPPLRLAAFRRLLDSSKPWATASGLRESGEVCGKGDGSGDGGGYSGWRPSEGPRGQVAIGEGVAAEEAGASGAWRGGQEGGSSRSRGVGSVDDLRDRELAQAGCLIEVKKLRANRYVAERSLDVRRAALVSRARPSRGEGWWGGAGVWAAPSTASSSPPPPPLQPQCTAIQGASRSVAVWHSSRSDRHVYMVFFS